jgi:hypothetical protein
MLAAAVEDGGAGRKAIAELAGEIQADAPLGGTERVAVPLRPLGKVTGVERRLAAHGEGEARAGEPLVELVAGRKHRLPHFLFVGAGRPGLVPEARHLHLEGDLAGAGVARAFERRRKGGIRRAGQGNVSLAAEQARGRVEADPARAG